MVGHVFISYCREDLELAQEIVARLERAGLTCAIDLNITAGSVWEEWIAAAIERTRAMVVLATPQGAQSEWVPREWRMAQELRKPVVPIKITEKVPPELEALGGATQFVTFAKGVVTDAGMERLLAGLRESASLGVLAEERDKALLWDRLSPLFDPLPIPLRETLDGIADTTRRLFAPTPCHPAWAVHGLRHANALLGHLCQILRDTPLEPRKLFCLAAAACLHDVALVAPEFADEAPEVLCLNHAERAVEWLERGEDAPALDPVDRQLIEHLIRYHNTAEDPRVLAEDRATAHLTAAFRLANACDLGHDRAPVALWERYREQIEAAGQSHFWLLNAAVRGIVIEDGRIAIGGRYPAEELRFIPELVGREIERRLALGEAHLRGFTVALERQLDPKLRLPVAWEDMVRLALSLATSRVRSLAAPTAHLESSSSLLDYLSAAAEAIADPRHSSSDPGARLRCLCDAVEALLAARGELHLLHAVKAEVHEALSGAAPDGEKLDRVALAITRFGTVRNASVVAGVVQVAARLMPEDLHRAYRVFVFGRSRLTSDFIKHCHGLGYRLEVITPMMRPVGEGATPALPRDFRDRSYPRLTITLVPDAAIAHVLRGEPSLTETTEEAAPPPACDLVLMGCEAVFVRAGRELADVGTSLGARAVAQLARAAGVPVWVMTDAAKFCAYPAQSPWYGAYPIQTLAGRHFVHEESVLQQGQRLAEPYPRSEVVPGEAVALIVTEEGAFTSLQAAARVQQHLHAP